MASKLSKGRISRLLSIGTALLALVMLAAFSSPAIAGARRGLDTCASVIVPSLLPFFVLSSLLSALGGPALLGRRASKLMSKLFGVSGGGAPAFLLGLSGGYPLGAAAVCDLYRRGDVEKGEAERLLGFCNNSGPAFILGAAGAGVFGSAKLGLLLYLSHALAALLLGAIQRGGKHRSPNVRPASPRAEIVPFSRALPDSVFAAVRACAVICGFVVFFSALTATLTALGILPGLSLFLSRLTGLEPSWTRGLITGILELGSGVSGLRGLPPSPVNLALCSFILGFGGLCVQCQTLALCSQAGLKCGRHTLSRVAHGLLSAAITAGLALLCRGL